MKNGTGAARKIYIRGNFGEGNFGDDALLAANQMLARDAGAETILLGEPSPFAALPAPLPAVPEVDLQDAGLVLFGGGTQFFTPSDAQPVEEAPRQRISSKLLRLLHNPQRTWRSLAFRVKNAGLARIPHAAIGLGVGPFSSKHYRDEKTVARLLKRMDFLWLRDSSSAAFCEQNGIDDAVLGADLCFTTTFRDSLSSQYLRPKSASENRIGIILRDHGHLDNAFKAKMKDVYNRLRQSGATVDIISFSAADCFVDRYKSDGHRVVSWNPQRDTIDSFAQRLASYEVLLTSRFHGAVFGVLTSTPFVVVGIDAKLQSLRERYKLADVDCVDPTSSADAFLDAINRTRSRREVLYSLLSQEAAAERSLVAKPEAAFAAFLRNIFSGEGAVKVPSSKEGGK